MVHANTFHAKGAKETHRKGSKEISIMRHELCILCDEPLLRALREMLL